MDKTPQQIVIEFAQSFEKCLGTERTTVLLESLTNFANTCPETVKELEVLVIDNPQVFGNLLTPQGVEEAKELIENVSNYLPLMAVFGK